MLRTLAALAGCAALVGAAELPVETQTVNAVALKVSNRADVTLKVRDGDKDVKNRELWYRSYANSAWGTYWSWDPKETWSLITWLLYSAVLHASADARQGSWRPVLHVAAFLALLTTFILVNVLPKLGSALHGYA